MSVADGSAWLEEALANGGAVVTASRRLARALRTAFDDVQAAAGLDAWASPDIHSIHAWLANLADQRLGTTQSYLRLGEHAAAQLWQQSLDEVARGSLPNRAGFVRHCIEAWSRCSEWCVPLDEVVRHARSPDERLYARAATAYAESLRAQQFLDAPGLAAAVTELVRNDAIRVPGKLRFAGFDRLTPSLQRLIDACISAGCDIELLESGVRAANVRCFTYPDPNAELRAAGAWARDLLLQNPALRVGIVCTDLQNDAVAAARLVRDGFVPGWQYADSSFASAVNVSYGQRLADYPAIAFALMLLRWTCSPLTSQELSVLLRSRCCAPSHGPGRARMELDLRRYPERLWSPAVALDAWKDLEQTTDSKAWLDAVRCVNNCARKYPDPASPAAWADAFDAVLQSIGWPAGDSLTSTEFQLINRWRGMLNEFAASEAVVQRLELYDAVNAIVGLASEIVFQAESSDAQIDVLGALETAGLRFDALWVTGVDAARWPAAPNPLALVSRRLQRDFGMPDATPLDTLEYSSRVLERLLSSAPSVVVSWARHVNDVETSPSELLTGLATQPDQQIDDPGWHAKQYVGRGNIEVIDTDPAPALAPAEKIQGGAGTVQRQYTEPFSAFAYGRLGIRDLPRFEPGISARSRGTMVHRGLKVLFSDCPDLNEILSWSEKDIESRTAAAAEQAASAYYRLADTTLRYLLGLESERLACLLQEFIAKEKSTRAPFAIAAVERSLRYSHAGIELDLQIDRVDRLDDGSSLIIDYKTGAPKGLLTRQGDLVELQPVVYSCAWPHSVGGLVLINVDRRAISYRGASASKQWDRAGEEDWPARLTHWQQLVHSALDSIAKGDVRVNLSIASDKSRPLAMLSRVEEIRRAY